MEPQDYAISHFDGMSRLGRALKELPAQILRHEYHGEAFGSWLLTFRYRGSVAELAFDGKDDLLQLRRSADRHPPYGFGPWKDVSVVGGVATLDDAAVQQIVSAVVGP